MSLHQRLFQALGWLGALFFVCFFLAAPLSAHNRKVGDVVEGVVLEAVQKLEDNHALRKDEIAVVVDPHHQELYVVKDRSIEHVFPISTSKKGMNNIEGSLGTPWGSHYISNKIGDDMPIGTMFKGREVCKRRGCSTITTRILWLRGLEEGVNLDLSIDEGNYLKKRKHVDSHWRLIYIHGTSRERKIGKPGSIGCINMKNKDVIALFDMVREGTLVEIIRDSYKAH